MNWLTNEVMFYGGIVVAGCSLVSGIIYLGISHIRRIRLDVQLDDEYGKRETNRYAAGNCFYI